MATEGARGLGRQLLGGVWHDGVDLARRPAKPSRGTASGEEAAFLSVDDWLEDLSQETFGGQEICTTASTSTATPAGRPAAETAARECLPLSPNTSTMRSEAPFTTFGWSVKSPVELTKPVSFTTRCPRSRSPPQAALTCAPMLMAQSLAAACPSSSGRPAPSLPWYWGLPSFLGSWTDTKTRLPVCTKPT